MALQRDMFGIDERHPRVGALLLAEALDDLRSVGALARGLTKKR